MIEPKNLLLVRTDRIGDVVLTLPVARLIKKYFPDCKITFLARNYTKDLVLNHPFIDNVVLLKEKNGKILIKDNISEILALKFDSCILFYPTFIMALILFLSRIKNRIGTGYRWYSFLFNQKIYQHRKFAEMHELEFNVRLLAPLGINEKVTPEEVEFGLTINKEADEKIKSLLNKYNVDSSMKIIIVHPGSGGSAIDLPINKFKELMVKLNRLKNIVIILTGNEEEKEICNLLQIKKEILNFSGLLNLQELAALINSAKMLIANSTGPLHIASALGIKVIGFYPKILECSSKRWGPYSSGSFVFEPKLDCTNCTREQCERLGCMNTIDIDEVFSIIKKEIDIS